MNVQTTSIKALHEAILTGLEEHFGDQVAQYGAYEPWNPFSEAPATELRTPALLLELERLGADPAASLPGAIALRCSWAVHVILSDRTEGLRTALPELAAAVAARVLRTNIDPLRPPLTGARWALGEAVGPPETVSAAPAEFSPALHGHDAWMITWEQVAYLPETLPTD